MSLCFRSCFFLAIEGGGGGGESETREDFQPRQGTEEGMGRDAETVRGNEGGNRGRRVGWSTTTVSRTPPPPRARTPVFLPPHPAMCRVHV